MPGSDSFWLRVNHPPARTALCPWDEVSFPTVHQISCLGSAGCATGHDDLIVPIVPRARTTAALDTVDCFFADPPFNLGKDYGTDVHDEHPEDHAVV